MPKRELARLNKVEWDIDGNRIEPKRIVKDAPPDFYVEKCVFLENVPAGKFIDTLTREAAALMLVKQEQSYEITVKSKLPVEYWGVYANRDISCRLELHDKGNFGNMLKITFEKMVGETRMGYNHFVSIDQFKRMHEDLMIQNLRFAIEHTFHKFASGAEGAG